MAALGHAANVHSLMPFYMMIFLGFLKPLVTIWLLGPPAGVIDGQQDPLLAVDAATADSGPSRKDIMKREGPACMFIVLALIGLQNIVWNTWCALEAPNTFTEVMMLWANAPGVASMVNIVTALGLYAEGDAAATMLLGNGAGPLRGGGPVERRLEELFGDFFGTLLLATLAVPLGGLWGSLDRSALSRIPSRGQQWLTLGLWCCFKPVFHVLLIVALPGIVAYVWLFLGLLFGIWVGSALSQKYALPAALSARRLLGTPSEQINAARGAVEGEVVKWGSYLFWPTLFAVMAPVFVPLTLRLLSGEGYWVSLYKTWEDRHAAAYFDNLLSKANHSLASAWNKTEVVTALLGTIV